MTGIVASLNLEQVWKGGEQQLCLSSVNAVDSICCE